MNTASPVAASTAPGTTPMPRLLVGIIASYLVAVITLAGLGVYAMWPDGAAPTAVTAAPAAAGSAASHAAAVQPGPSKERSVMLLVCYLGIIGSCIHAMTSLATFVGNKSFHASWTLWYLLRPMIGGALAWVAYLVFRGGFLGQEPGAVLNPFAFGALGALSGLFSKRVVDKLSELVDVLFRMPPGRGDDARTDKPIPRDFRIIKVEPAQLSRQRAATCLTISGAGFAPGSVVEVAQMLLMPSSLSPDYLNVELPAAAYVDRQSVTLTVRLGGPQGARSNTVSLPVEA